MQPVPVPDLSDQLEFLVIKILGGDFHSIFPLIKEKNFLSPIFATLDTEMRVYFFAATPHTCDNLNVVASEAKKKKKQICKVY